MTKVLFVPSNSREVAQSALVKPELERLGAEVVAIALDGSREAQLERAGFRFRRLGDYKTMNMVDVIDREKPNLVQASFVGIVPNVYALAVAASYRSIPCLQIYDGIVFDPQERMKKVSLFRGSLLILMKQVIHTLTRRSSLRQVIVLLQTLKATSTPMRFVKGLPGEILKFSFPARRSHAYREGLTMGVPGQYAKDVFISIGFPPERVLVTGQPRLDLIFRKQFDRNGLLSSLGIPPDKDIVVLATQPLYLFWSREDRKTFIRAITHAMDDFPPEEQLVIKLHPEEHIEDYQRMLEEIGCGNAILCQDVDLYQLLNACSLLMTTHSTVALEAFIFNKPVLCIDFTGRCPISFYTDDGAAIAVRREEDLVPALHQALYDPQTREGMEQARKRFLSKHIHKPDGQTSRRIAELIIQLAQESKIRTTLSER